jgi:hypothetical protein
MSIYDMRKRDTQMTLTHPQNKILMRYAPEILKISTVIILAKDGVKVSTVRVRAGVDRPSLSFGTTGCVREVGAGKRQDCYNRDSHIEDKGVV